MAKLTPYTPISAVMTPRVITIRNDLTVADAIERMTRERVRHLPVTCEFGQLQGIVSARDLMMIQSVVGKNARSTTVEAATSYDLYQVTPDTPVLEVVDTMVERSIGATLITEAAKLCGIFTTVDTLRFLKRVFQQEDQRVGLTPVS